MEPTDKELLEKALVDAERLVLNEVLHRYLSANKSTEMLDIAAKELAIIRRKNSQFKGYCSTDYFYEVKKDV